MLYSIYGEHIPPTATSQSDLDPELAPWFTETIRLFVEALDRAAAGNIRSALSSLAAVTPVHSLLVEDNAELSGGGAGSTETDLPNLGLHP